MDNRPGWCDSCAKVKVLYKRIQLLESRLKVAEELAVALQVMLDDAVSLRLSGDAGNYDEQPEEIQAKQVLTAWKKTKGDR